MSLKHRSKPAYVFVNLLTVLATASVQMPLALANSDAEPVISTVTDPFSSVDAQLLSRYLKPGTYMDVHDIKPGMTGFGLSVFQGTKPERFNVTVIGVVKKVLSGRDAVLVRLSGAKMGKCNVIRGMSGSPVYIDNKLIGAVSYGFDFSTEPIAGITPIAEMLDALSHEESDHHAPTRISTALPMALPPEAVRSIETSGANGSSQVSGGSPHMVPLMAPVSLSGFSPRAEQFLSDRFKPQGIWVSSGAGGGMDPSLEQPKPGVSKAETMPPGAAVSVLLTSGDFVTSACGTATATIGDHVLAFGHPFMTAGSVEFPMATSYIHQILPSLSVSFKLASPVREVGSFVSDRPWSISGQLGKVSKMIPVTYSVTDQARHVKRVFHCTVINHPDLTPNLIAATAISAIDSTHQSSAPYVLKVKSAIEATGVGKIEREDRYSSNGAHSGGQGVMMGGGDPVSAFLVSTTSKIVDNEFQQSEIKSVDLDIVLEDGHDSAKIERVFTDKPVVEPGESLAVHCLLRPYGHDPIDKELHLTVPRDVPDGPLLLGVSSGDDIDQVRKKMGLVDPPSDNFKQVVDKIRDAGSGDTLTVVMALPEQSILIGSQILRNPPSHWSKLFFSDRYTHGPSLIRSELRTSEQENYLLDGSHLITVEVRRAEKAASRAAPYLPAPPVTPIGFDHLYMTDSARKTADAVRKPDVKDSSTSSVVNDKVASTNFWTATKEYPHMRSLLVWLQESSADFSSGKTDATTVDSWGRITPAFEDLAQQQLNKEPRIWSSVWSNGNFYFGATDKVYRWNGESKSTAQVVAKIDGLAVPSLVADSSGNIYAASVPSGKIYKLSSNNETSRSEKNTGEKNGTNGKLTFAPLVIADLPEHIITCLSVDDDDNVYAGVTGSGRVYKLKAGPSAETKIKPEVFFDSGQGSVTSLSFCPFDKRLYVGTAEKGAVYSIDKAGKAKAEYQTQDRIVTGCVKDSKGDLFVSTAAQGHLIMLSPDGAIVNLAGSDAFYSLYYDRACDQVFSGDAEGDITHLKNDALSHDSFFVPVCHTEQEAVPTLCSDGKGRLFAATANLGMVRTFAMKPATNASYTSAVKDGGRMCKWSRLRAFGAYNEVSKAIASQITVSSRSGQTAQPDSTWSAWQSATYSTTGGTYALNSPAGRYLQYKLSWKDDQNRTVSPKHLDDNAVKVRNTIAPVTIGRVEVSYQPNNLAPEFSTISVRSGAARSGKEEITVDASDADGDNLSLAIEVSNDGGKTWNQIARDLRSRTKEKRNYVEIKPQQPQDQSGAASNPEGGDRFAVNKVSHVSSTPSADRISRAHAPRGEISPRSSNPAKTANCEAQNLHKVDLGRAMLGEDRSDDRASYLSDSKPSGQDSGSGDKDAKNGRDGGSASGDKSEDKDKDKEAKRDESDKPKDDQSRKAETNSDQSKDKSRLPSGQPLAQTQQTDTQTGTEKIAWDWDTTKLQDGSYLVKFIISDQPSNPMGHLQSIALRTVEIENSAPEITSIKLTHGKGDNASIKVVAHDGHTPIVNAIYRFDDGEPFALGDTDNIADGLDAQFEAQEIAIPHGSHKLEVQVTNKAGNTATKTVSAI